MPKVQRRGFILSLAVLAVFLAGLVLWLLHSRPPFDPAALAEAERGMWQDYYSGRKARLGLKLIAMLRRYYGLTTAEATKIGECLADSAMTFRTARGNYEQKCLPSLKEAYRRIKQATGASFDADAVARAELTWWITRRTPGHNSPEQVGAEIGKLYALLYGGAHPAFVRAGVLRAEAAALRREGGDQADWKCIEELLFESYRELEKGKKAVSQVQKGV